MTDTRIRFQQEAVPHIDAAYNLARWLTRSTADAEDIVQDALLLAFRNFNAQRGSNTKAWLLAIVRNCFRTTRRRDAARPVRAEGPDGSLETAPPTALVSPDDPEREAIAADRARTLDAALAQLSEEYREVLVLRELEGMSYQEIASVIGSPIGTVMSRLARARAALKASWAAEPGSADGLP
jgi:RNA polymerase sigma factor (sigma-70 family)